MFVKHIVAVAEVVLLYAHLQVWPYNSFYPAYLCISKNFIKFKCFSGFVEFDCLKNNVHPNFISEFKAIGHCFFRIENFDGLVKT